MSGWLALLLIAVTPVMAHDAGYFETHRGGHGGRLQPAGPYHLELLAGSDGITVYVTDHGDVPQPTAGFKATATILAGSQRLKLPLLPAGDNRLRAADPVPAGPGAKFVISVNPGKGAAQIARFEFKVEVKPEGAAPNAAAAGAKAAPR